MPLLNTKNKVAIYQVNITIQGEETVWHFRRATPIDHMTIELDLAPYRSLLQQNALLYIENSEDLEFTINDNDPDNFAKKLEVSKRLSKLDFKHPTKEMLVPLYSWLKDLVIRVDGFKDEEGQAVRWSELTEEDKDEAVSFLNHGDVNTIIKSVCDHSSLSEVSKKK